MATNERTFTPNALAVMLTKTLGHTKSPKQVRGRVRGDSGTPLLARFGPDVKAPTQAHVYTAREADVIGEAMVASDNARTGRSVKWHRVGPASAPRKPAAKRATKPAATKPAPASAAPSTGDASGQ